MNLQTLESCASRIEATLASYGIPGRVTGGTLAPRQVRFTVAPRSGVRLAGARDLDQRLALALGIDACRAYRRGNVLVIEFPRSDPRSVYLLPLQQRLAGKIPPDTAILGVAEDGSPLLVRLPSPDVIVTEGGGHLLIAGTAGAGKTILARSVVTSLALSHQRRQLGFVLVGRAFEPLAGLPHLLHPVLADPAPILGRLVALMGKRRTEARSAPTVVVVIDELAELLAPTCGDDDSEAVEALIRHGHRVGIHLVACARTPFGPGVLPLVGRFPVRLVGQVGSRQDAFQAAGFRAAGAERLEGRGDFLAVAGGRTTRFQAAYVTDADLALIAPRPKPRQAPAGEAAVAVRPEPTIEDALAACGLCPVAARRYLDGSVEVWVEGAAWPVGRRLVAGLLEQVGPRSVALVPAGDRLRVRVGKRLGAV